MLWNENTNENIIIVNTVSVTKVPRINLLIPLISIFPLIALTNEKHKHTLTTGIKIRKSIFSMRAINVSIVALPRAAEDIFPLIICITVNTGAKLFITSQRIFI